MVGAVLHEVVDSKREQDATPILRVNIFQDLHETKKEDRYNTEEQSRGGEYSQ